MLRNMNMFTENISGILDRGLDKLMSSLSVILAVYSIFMPDNIANIMSIIALILGLMAFPVRAYIRSKKPYY